MPIVERDKRYYVEVKKSPEQIAKEQYAQPYPQTLTQEQGLEKIVEKEGMSKWTKASIGLGVAGIGLAILPGLYTAGVIHGFSKGIYIACFYGSIGCLTASGISLALSKLYRKLSS